MFGLLIANLILTGLIFLALLGVGVRIAVLSVRANAQRRRRLDPETVKAGIAALTKLAAATKAKQQSNVSPLKRDTA